MNTDPKLAETLKRHAEDERRRETRRTIYIVVVVIPIATMVVLALRVMVKM